MRLMTPFIDIVLSTISIYDTLVSMTNQRVPRNSLTYERVVEGARELADERGLDALTIRALATHLGVKPMSIYHYVANKELLLDALVDLVFKEFYTPDPDGRWRVELANRARSVRAVVSHHPWALAILETRTHPGPANLNGHESVLEVLHRAGFTVEAAAHAYAILDAFVYGFVLQDIMLRSIQLDTSADALRAEMDFSNHPRLAEMAAFYVRASSYPLNETFEVGLGITLDGIEQLHHQRNPGRVSSKVTAE